jgi:hypothetical protein
LVVNHRTIPLNRLAAGGKAQRQVIVAISGGVELNATWDQIKSTMTTQTSDTFPSALKTGAEEIRSTLQPVEIGVGQSPVKLRNSRWFADQRN